MMSINKAIDVYMHSLPPPPPPPYRRTHMNMYILVTETEYLKKEQLKKQFSTHTSMYILVTEKQKALKRSN